MDSPDAETGSVEGLAATMRALNDGRPVFGQGWRRKWREVRFLRALGRHDYRAVLTAYYAGSPEPGLLGRDARDSELDALGCDDRLPVG
jgi:hypothetical protein